MKLVADRTRISIEQALPPTPCKAGQGNKGGQLGSEAAAQQCPDPKGDVMAQSVTTSPIHNFSTRLNITNCLCYRSLSQYLAGPDPPPFFHPQIEHLLFCVFIYSHQSADFYYYIVVLFCFEYSQRDLGENRIEPYICQRRGSG